MFDEPAANYRPNGGRNCTETRPGANRASTLVFRKRTANDSETTGNEEGGAEALRCTGDNQLMNVGREAAPRRRHSKESDAHQENSAPSVVISERPANKQKR